MSPRVLGVLAGAVISTGLGLLLAISSSAAAPDLNVVATDAIVGQAIHATAQLSESPNASGEISFEVFGPGDPSCSGPGLTPAPASVSVTGEGEYSSGDFTPPEAGTYRWSAHYSGDLENPAADSSCSAVSNVGKASPELAGTASGGVVNTAIHDEVAVTGAFSPTGEVVFRVYGPTDTGCLTPLETNAVTIQGGHATSADFLPQQAGEFRWTAAYEGDANNEAIETPCGAAEQSSAVGKAAPSLAGVASSAVTVGQAITDVATLAGGFEAGGELVFRAYGPGDPSCSDTPEYEATVAVDGNGPYSPPGFSPPAGLYRWTAAYEGDANNEAIETPCGAAEQSSAVGTIAVTLEAGASSGTVGDPLTASASIQNGATPVGQITFTAFSPGDVNCSGAAAFSSTISASGNGSYRSAAFVPTRVGAFRWTVSYSGDPNHSPTTVACGKATSSVSQARPSITSTVTPRLTVGSPVQITATLQGGYAPTGTVSFQIYGPAPTDCAKPLSIDTVAVAGNGAVSSDPFVPQRPGRYSFVASYSGDTANQKATEPCDPSGQAVEVDKRMPKLKPRARLLGRNRILIRAHLSSAVSPSGVINFRLYRPGDNRCKGKPAFSGGVTVRSNGSYLLAQYLATRSGTYRLSVGYSGDQRNRRYKGTCLGAQPIHIS
jgi:hypothetical protein